MSKELIEIDGSVMEGGGQVLRIALTFSVLTKRPVRIKQIRAGRSKPGLMEQHLKGVELVRDISQAKVKGAQIGSTEIEFWPTAIKAGTFQATVRTAGSISLLLQVALPCALFASGDVTLKLRGGTNAEMAPQVDYTTEVFRPVLEKFGASFDFDLVRRGYFPRGGGEVVVNVKPVKGLKAVQLLQRGEVTSVYGWSFVAGAVPLRLAHEMADTAVNVLRGVCNKISIERYKEDSNVAHDNAAGIILVAKTSTDCIIGSDALSKRREKGEETGRRAAEHLLQTVKDGACVDIHSQDQIIVFMALAQGCSQIRVAEVSMHTRTAIFIAEIMTGVKFDVHPEGSTFVMKCEGVGMVS